MLEEDKEPSRILIIEDNPDDCFFLTRQLNRARLDDHVTVIPDGQEALDFLLQNASSPNPVQFVCIFLDLRLPSLDGIPLLRKLRVIPALSEIPIVVMTSSNEERDLEECRRLSVKAYVTKPVRLTDFIKAVTHVFPATENSVASAT
jgi:two-component system response regulator